MHACTHTDAAHGYYTHTLTQNNVVKHKAILYVILPLARTTKRQNLATSKNKQLTEMKTKFS